MFVIKVHEYKGLQDLTFSSFFSHHRHIHPFQEELFSEKTFSASRFIILAGLMALSGTAFGEEKINIYIL